MTFELKKKLQLLIDYAYSNNSKCNLYKKFYYELNSKIMKSKAGDYDLNKKKIRIFAVGSVNPTQLFITSLHELAHHIDNINRHMTDHSEEFYNIYKVLLFVALDNKIITVDDIYKFSNGNTSDKNKVLQMLGNYKTSTKDLNSTPKETDYNTDKVKINVFNCFNVKERLKMVGYKWNPLFKSWVKEVNKNDVSSELTYLLKYVSKDSIKLGNVKWEEK